jgi:prepilin-type processing-associated H-X9-DG protein
MSGIWICPARPEPFLKYGVTYAYTATNINIGQMTSIHRSRTKNDNTAVVFDNTNWLPYVPGAPAPNSVTGYTMSPTFYVHKTKSKKTALNILYLDGHVALQSS